MSDLAKDKVVSQDKKRRRRTTPTTSKGITKGSKMAAPSENVNKTPNMNIPANTGSPMLTASSIFMPTSTLLSPGPCINPWQNDISSKMDLVLKSLSILQGTQNEQKTTLNSIAATQSSIIARLDRMESNISDTNKRVSDVETSQTFLSDQYDTVSTCTSVNKTCISNVQGELKTLSSENVKLKQQNEKLQDDITDLQLRSMRDNLLIMGVQENQNFRRPVLTPASQTHVPSENTVSSAETMDTTPITHSNGENISYASVSNKENCTELAYDFCEFVLDIPTPKSKIQIDRAHRIGAKVPGKTQPIVMKLIRSDDKALIQSAVRAKGNLRGTTYKVTEQYPKSVQEKRRQLIPIMLELRGKGRKAVLSRDKLIVDGRPYNPDRA